MPSMLAQMGLRSKPPRVGLKLRAEAKNRYLPSSSKQGAVSSVKSLVTRCTLPPSSSYRKMERKPFSSALL